MKLVSCSGVMAPEYTMLPPSSRLSAMLVLCAVVPATRYRPHAADWRMPTAYSLLQGAGVAAHAWQWVSEQVHQGHHEPVTTTRAAQKVADEQQTYAAAHALCMACLSCAQHCNKTTWRLWLLLLGSTMAHKQLVAIILKIHGHQGQTSTNYKACLPVILEKQCTRCTALLQHSPPPQSVPHSL